MIETNGRILRLTTFPKNPIIDASQGPKYNPQFSFDSATSLPVLHYNTENKISSLNTPLKFSLYLGVSRDHRQISLLILCEIINFYSP